MKRYLIGFLTSLALSAPLSALAGFSNMYVFGDSLSDNGNLYQWTGAPNPVSSGTAIPVSPPYTAGRFENGKSYSELLWNGLRSASHLPSNSGELTPRGLKLYDDGGPGLDTGAPAGTNYAVGGARSRYHRFDLTTGELPPVTLPLPPAPGSATYYQFSLRGQFDQYEADHAHSADPEALYVVWAGSNDVGDALQLVGQNGDPMNPFAWASARLAEALADVQHVLVGLVLEGAENLLVPNVPDLGLVPEVNSNAPAAAVATALSIAYNASLSQILAGLYTLNADLNIYGFDSFAFLRQAVAAPQDFGFSNVTDACLQGLFVAPPATGPVSVCNTPDEYLFWDTLHPSARAHEIIAARMLTTIPEPATLLLVAISLGGFLLGTRRGVPQATRRASIAATR